MKRLVTGKVLGFVLGFIGLIFLPYMFPDVSMMFRVGVMLWWVLIGAVIAMAGVVDRHPIFHFKINGYMRGLLLGAFMNFILVLVAYDTLVSLFATGTVFMGVSPFWLVLEGAVFGLLIEAILTKQTGQGRALCED